jgi:hypothetical protein
MKLPQDELLKLAYEFSETRKEFGESRGRGFVAGYRTAEDTLLGRIEELENEIKSLHEDAAGASL